MPADTGKNLWTETQDILGVHAYVASLPRVTAAGLAQLMLTLTLADTDFSGSAAVVSTCSRLEFYAAAALPQLDTLPHLAMHQQGIGHACPLTPARTSGPRRRTSLASTPTSRRCRA